jgi:hypothetical protein
MENAFAGEERRFAMSLKSGQYIDDGDGFPSSKKKDSQRSWVLISSKSGSVAFMGKGGTRP